MNLKKLLFGIFIVSLTVLNINAEGKKYDFGDSKSATITSKAWAALQVKDWEGVEVFTDKCISLYTKQAIKQQSELKEMPKAAVAFNFWALNDVGTCYFIKAKAFKEQGKLDLAKKACDVVLNDFSFSQCWDQQGWFWSVAQACQDLKDTLGANIDYEDYTSETLTRKAWEAFGANNVVNAIIYAKKAISLYEKDAKKQQASLTNFAPKENAFDYWALNDVGTCYFVLGEAYSQKKEWAEAVEAYRTAVEEYSYAQCWDPRGWFWKPAVASRGKLNKIMAEQGIS